LLKFTEKLTRDHLIKQISRLLEHEQEQARKRARDVDRTDIKQVTQLLHEHATREISTPFFVAGFTYLFPLVYARLHPLAHHHNYVSPTTVYLSLLIPFTMLTLLRLRPTLLGMVRINQHHLNPTGDRVSAQLRIFENGIVIIVARGYQYCVLPLHLLLDDVKQASFYGNCSKLLPVDVDLDKKGEPIGLTYQGEFDWLPFILKKQRLGKKRNKQTKKINFPMSFSPQPA
jgi:hypothetical protein